MFGHKEESYFYLDYIFREIIGLCSVAVENKYKYREGIKLNLQLGVKIIQIEVEFVLVYLW